MRWFILLLILSTLFITGCTISKIEKQPVLEQYVLIRVGNTTIENSQQSYQAYEGNTASH